MRFLYLFLVILSACTSVSEKVRAPAGTSNDSCQLMMQSLMLHEQTLSREGVQLIQTQDLIEQGLIKTEIIHEIESSPVWKEFFATHSYSSTEEEQILIAALLRQNAPAAP